MPKLLLLTWLLLAADLSFAQPIGYRLEHALGTPIDSPHVLAIDRRGTVYIAGSGSVIKLDSTGHFMTSFRQAANLAGAVIVAADAAGNVYMDSGGNGEPNDAVRKYSPSGQLLMHCGTVGPGPRQTETFSRLRMGPTGTIYVTDEYHRRLLRFDL